MQCSIETRFRVDVYAETPVARYQKPLSSRLKYNGTYRENQRAHYTRLETFIAYSAVDKDLIGPTCALPPLMQSLVVVHALG